MAYVKKEPQSSKVDVEKVKALFSVSKISMSSFCKMIGKNPNHLSARLHMGTVDNETLSKICTMFDAKMEDLVIKEEIPADAPKTENQPVPSVNLSEIQKKLQSIDDLQVEIISQLKMLNKEQPVNEAYRVDSLKALNEILDTLKNMKVEMHNDSARIYNHLKFNPLAKAQ